MFSVFGEIVDVFIHQNPTLSLPEEEDPLFPLQKNIIAGYRVAYIVFRSSTSVQNLLNLKPNEIPPLILGKTETGLRRWVSLYNSQLVDFNVLENSVKTFMSNYEREELRKKTEEKNNEGQADDEGWITVSRK